MEIPDQQRPAHLWDHQWEEIKYHSYDPARALFWEPRTGKTKTIVLELSFLEQSLSDGPQSLIVAPQIATRVWRTELSRAGIYCEALTSGSLNTRLEMLDGLSITVRRSRNRGTMLMPTAVIVNYDIVYSMRRELQEFGFDALVCDESHYIKTPGSRRARAMHLIAPTIPWRRLLTGTPDPKDYADYYSQYKVLDPSIFGTNLSVFRERYINSHPLYPNKVLSYKNVEELRSKIFSVASRLRRIDCLSIPEESFETRTLPMPHWMQMQYRQVGIGEAPMAALLRKQQFLSNHKVSAVVSEVGPWVAANKKVVVFFRFREEEEKIKEALAAAYPGVPIYSMDGDTPLGDRAQVEEAFAPGKEEGAAICVCSIALGVSISLAAADCEITSTPDFDYNHYAQSKARIWKEHGKIVHIDLIYANSYDLFVQKNLTRKRNISQSLLDAEGVKPAVLSPGEGGVEILQTFRWIDVDGNIRQAAEQLVGEGPSGTTVRSD